MNVDVSSSGVRQIELQEPGLISMVIEVISNFNLGWVPSAVGMGNTSIKNSQQRCTIRITLKDSG